LATSNNFNQNYQFAFKKNTSGVTKTCQIWMFMNFWSGVTTTNHALAWAAGS